MNKFLKPEVFGRFRQNPRADSSLIDLCQASLKFRLPTDYVGFLQQSNGGEGFIGNRAYLVLWRVEDLVRMNAMYHVGETVPELFLFGSDGANEAFGFDIHSSKGSVVSVPFILMTMQDARIIAPNFDTFIESLSKSCE